ncbi:MAG: DUF4340 domain-containing protein [Bacteroidetes bacterium]|nr:DUF4340 domain-containing protein [Bacteroidota bacterium]
MKKNTVILVIVIVLSVLAGWLIYSKQSGTIKETLRDFAVKDTAAVVKIFMADKSGNQVTLEKKNADTWILNDKMDARPDAINTLLTTLKSLEVRSPVGKNAYNNVMKAIAAKGIKVEIYTAEGISKTIYVGGPTQDQLGTFMYLENSDLPFIIHIPGFDGYLTTRFIVKETDWIVKKVFRLADGELKSLKVTDREREASIYAIENNGNGTYRMSDESGNPINEVSQDKIISYLQFFSSINYEMEEMSLSQHQRDSIRAAVPFRSITLIKNDGTSTSIDLWRRPQLSSTVNKTNEAGQPYLYDIDRMTAKFQGDTNLIVVQYFSFEKLFRRIPDFTNNPVVK